MKGQIQFFKSGTQPKGFYSTVELKKTEKDFEKQISSQWTMNVDDYKGDSGKRWVKFENAFSCFMGLKFYAPIFRKGFYVVMKELIEDNVQYAELNTPFLIYDLDKNFSFEECLLEYKKLNEEFTSKYGKDFYGIRLKHEAVRVFNNETVRDHMLKSLDLQMKYDNFIVGFDLVGEEDGNNSNNTSYFIKDQLEIRDIAREKGIDFQFYLHGGETLWDIDNLFDLVTLGVKRIGHGLNLFKYPYLLDKVKEKDICIEVCPISNHSLGYINDLRAHPGILYLKYGLPVVLSPDDAGVLGYTGVTHDFFVVFMYWDLDLKGIKQLALNSIKYSGLKDKTKLQELWDNKYNEFIEDMLKEIGK